MAKAKKPKPERLPGAEQNCISPEQEAIVRWFRTVKFRKSLLGGVDEVSMWKKLEELYALYDAAIRAERTENAMRRFEGCGFGADRYPRDTLRGEGIAERKAIRPAHKAAFGKGILQGDGKRERGRAIPP